MYIYQDLARFILAGSETGPETKRHISLLFAQKAKQIYLRVRQALCRKLPESNTLQLAYSRNNEGNTFPIIAEKDYNVCLIDLPLNLSKGIELPYCIERTCRTLTKICPATDCSIIFWNSPHEGPLLDDYAAKFPPIRFAKIIQGKQRRTAFAPLKALLSTSQLAYFLKGWNRPELRAKGLLYHPDFGQFTSCPIEDILDFCREMDTQVRPWAIHALSSNAPTFPAESLATND